MVYEGRCIMENIVLIIGGLFKSLSWSDIFFFVVTLFLIIFLVYVFYLIRLDDEDEEGKEQFAVENKYITEPLKKEDKSLTKIVSELETDYNPAPIDLSDYEKEQENTAIISYQELLSKVNNNIYYDDDYDSGFDDVLVQKVDNKESKTQELVDLPKAVMMSYESEEAFLSALKVLQKNLVR